MRQRRERGNELMNEEHQEGGKYTLRDRYCFS